MGISLSGISSGIDTSSIVDQLMAIESQQLTRFTTRQRKYEAEATGLKDVQSKLKTLKSALADLQSSSLWGNAQTASSSDATRVATSIASSTVALPQDFSVEVTALATARRDDYAWGGQSQITFTHPTDSAQNVTISLSSGATTIDDAVKSINAANAPVWATKDASGNLLLQQRTAGANPTAWTVAFDGVTQTDASPVLGTDTQYAITRGGVDVTPAGAVTDNKVTFEGVELSFKATTEAGKPVVVNVGSPGIDEEAVKTKVNAFITAYNDVVTKTREKLDEKRVADASTTSDAVKGQLFGDTGLTSILSSLRQKVSAANGSSESAWDQLSDIGISTGKSSGTTATADAKMGKLSLDADAFADALEDPVRLRTLLSGFAEGLEDLVNEQTKTSGTLDSRLKANAEEVTRVKAAYSKAEERLEAKETRLKAQFAAMESALSSANTQSSWLTSSLASLPSWS
jgi:flagellar hook-associated protein 2